MTTNLTVSKSTFFKVITFALFGLMVLIIATIPAKASAATFTNPVITDGADPQVLKDTDGFYYFIEGQADGIYITKSASLSNIGSGVKTHVYTPPTSGQGCCNLWAPEIWKLSSKYYIYYTADDGLGDANHRIFVLEATSPLGPYTYKAKLSSTYSIDASILQTSTGLYLMYTTGCLQMQALSNPYTLSGSPSQIACATQTWEDGWVEGPRAITHNGTISLTYSGNYANKATYAIGLMVLGGTGDPKIASNWTKNTGPIFTQYSGADGAVYGPGRLAFVKSADDTEDWIIYHAKYNSADGWDRYLSIQKFTWNTNNTPNLGHPIPRNIVTNVPSGDPAVTWTTVDHTVGTYSGTWENWTEGLDYNGGGKGSNTAGSYVTYTFTGTGIQWIGQKDSNFGQADVLIDNVFQTMVNAYNPTNLFQQTLYTKTGLSNGTHTIKIWVNGEHTSGTGNYIEVDAFKFTTG